MVELLPALQIVLHLLDQLVQFFVAHRVVRLGGPRVESFGCKKNNRTPAQLASGDFQTRIIDDQFRERQLGVGGVSESRQDLVRDVRDQLRRKAGRERAHEHLALPVHGKAAGGQPQQSRRGFRKILRGSLSRLAVPPFPAAFYTYTPGAPCMHAIPKS